MKRRTLLQLTSGLAAAQLDFGETPIPVIDAHTHFFDPRRPEGIVWPKKEVSFYRPVLPDEFIKLTKPFNVKGTVVVESSARMEDNDWAFTMSEKNPIIVGYVGRLTPGTPDFPILLEKYRKNPLFLGIRISFAIANTAMAQPQVLADLKIMANAGLQIDLGGAPNQLHLTLIQLAKISDRIPNLRMVLNHLPMPRPENKEDFELLKTGFEEMKHHLNIYGKLSQVIRTVDQSVPTDLEYWRDALDEVYAVFGPDRVIYGSNWPASLLTTEYPPVFNLVQKYFAGKGREVSEKYFWKNSLKAYRWVKRDASQPG